MLKVVILVCGVLFWRLRCFLGASLRLKPELRGGGGVWWEGYVQGHRHLVKESRLFLTRSGKSRSQGLKGVVGEDSL